MILPREDGSGYDSHKGTTGQCCSWDNTYSLMICMLISLPLVVLGIYTFLGVVAVIIMLCACVALLWLFYLFLKCNDFFMSKVEGNHYVKSACIPCCAGEQSRSAFIETIDRKLIACTSRSCKFLTTWVDKLIPNKRLEVPQEDGQMLTVETVKF
jgi:hypothetical protein